MTQTILIGDIHGCLHEFRDLLDKVGYTAGDRVICVGDFMDKGPYQAECVQFARANQIEAVSGNHDALHVRWRHREKARMLLGRPNNMRKLSQLDAAAHELLSDEDVEWLAKLPRILPFQSDGVSWVVVHGGLFPYALEKQPPDDVMYIRWLKDGKNVPIDYNKPETLGRAPEGAQHWTALWPGLESVVYGHEAFSLTEPLHTVKPTGVECWGIDTGAVHGGRLTALILNGDGQKRIVQVQARQKYMEPPVNIPLTLPPVAEL